MKKLLIKTLKIIGLSVLGLFVVLCLLILLFKYLNREPTNCAKVYNEIRVGMSLEKVENIIESVEPPIGINIISEGRKNTDLRKMAKFYIFYRSPSSNPWQYEIYFNDKGKVFNKKHWWD